MVSFDGKVRDKMSAAGYAMPEMYLRYVDDTLTVWHNPTQEQLDAFFEIMNKIHPNIKVTHDSKNEKATPFLDMLIHNSRHGDKWCKTTVYRKPTETIIPPHRQSCLPPGTFDSVARALLQRADTHCSEKTDADEEKSMVRALLKEHGYPRKTIYVDQRPKPDRSAKLSLKLWLPYMGTWSDMLKRILRKFDVELCHKSLVPLSVGMAKTHDRLPPDKVPGVVYSIPCAGSDKETCDKIYVGETSKTLTTRLHAHKTAKDNAKSELVDHRLATGHGTDFNKAKVVEREHSGGTASRRWGVEGAVTAKIGDSALNDRSKTMAMPKPWPSVLSKQHV
jgi:hypothetical protein